ncbi:E3 ubiquitin/ISG15 ligase TRIM25-like [Dendropsophus ebraccatus]|uniref:E3 ubiquitin/ISG15 ligase TRIM25-like n=1 Tax=Dendropsophus ebraccatus TaxID=150705 RepID=UPI0038313131
MAESAIPCTYCAPSNIPAIKTCLTCGASFCDKHLEVHSKAPEHILVDPTADPAGRKCSLHQEVLKYYCPDDSTCICLTCFLLGNHKGHNVELLSEASSKRKDSLRKSLEKLVSKRVETEERVQSLEELWAKVHEEDKSKTDRIANLFRDIKRKVEDLERKVLSGVPRKENQVCDLIQQLELKKDTLSSKIRSIQELCDLSDPILVLQHQEPNGVDTDVESSFKYVEPIHGLNDLDEGLISISMHRGLSTIITCVQEQFKVYQADDIIFDMNTAGDSLDISNDLKTIIASPKKFNRPKTQERFQYNQVLSTRSFSSGRHYWCVKTSEAGNWRVGVCYNSMERKGEPSYLGDNNKSWSLGAFEKQYRVTHNNHLVNLGGIVSSQDIAIYLDYDKGRLSFFELGDPIRHLYTFSALFTEPLHAAFGIWNSHLKIIR